ncbi:MAG TPA: ATP-binding cassette domain-containing protein, partial [Gammaproteobacteria bacterium]|nr:ATP-binding cassette domain-containing protein [Gammaproteobacteria bacterium]
CGIDGIVAQLPEGEQTQIVEGGARLSTGQRQRIALARALLGDPVLLLLDEVDSHLDPQAGAILDRVLAEHRGTVLIVTHNAERIAAADVIWHLEGGRLVETGTPAELLAAEGPTHHLFGVSRKAAL